MRAFFVSALLLISASPAVGEEQHFGLPIACTAGRDCWVQNYVDGDSSARIRDYHCGSQSYDGHDGTDFRVRDTSVNADVLASADGTVKAVRDGVSDHLVKTEADSAAVAKRECGNGVLVVHPGGWETQYCHLKQGSVTVKAGQSVKAGDRLGSVGSSGMAAFPHVHLTIRKDGKALDPFAPDAAQACNAGQAELWTEAAAQALAYQRGSVLRAGFAPEKVTVEALETGALEAKEPSLSWPAIVAYSWAINLEAGDVITVTLDGPGDYDATNRAVLERAKAQYLLFAGKPSPHVAGTYRGSFKVERDGKTVIAENWSADLQ